MADENTAEVAAEETQLQPEDAVVEEQQPEREPTASELASQMGWKPKEQWTGEPEAWKPASEFILAGRDITQSLSRELKSTRQELGTIAQTTSQLLQTTLAEREAEWQRKYDEAFDAGDRATADALLKQKPQTAAAQTGPDPIVAQWVAKNPWMDTDPLAASVAREISVRLAKEGVSAAEQLAAAEKEVKRRFPEHFPAVAKTPPATQTAAARNPNPSNRQKGFADMPQASQQAAIEFERLNGVKRESFAKQYWANEAKKRVGA